MFYADGYRSAFLDRTESWGYLSDERAWELADYAVAQAKHESANFTSPLFQSAFNANGYKYYPLSFWQSGKCLDHIPPEGGYYANYKTVSDSAGELADWIHRRKEKFVGVSDVYGYVAALQAGGWFTDSFNNYYSGVQRWYEQLVSAEPLSVENPGVLDQVVGAVKTSPVSLYVLGGIVLVIAFGGAKIIKKLI